MKHIISHTDERPSKLQKVDTQENERAGSVPRSPAGSLKNEPELELDDATKVDTPQPKEGQPMSKNQLKKLKKQQEWNSEERKEWRRAKRRDQHKAKQARKKDAKQIIQEKIASGDLSAAEALANEKQHVRAVQVPVSLIIDCDFNELMLPKEIISMGAQLTRCYSDNKSSKYRSHILISSWGGTLQERFETALASTHLNWKGMRFSEKSFVEAATDMDAVMRSPEGGKLAGALLESQTGEAALKNMTLPPDKDSLDPTLTSTERILSGAATSSKDCVVPSPTLAEPNKHMSDASSVMSVKMIVDPATKSPAPESIVSESFLDQSQSEIDTSSAENSAPNIVYLSSDSPHTLERLSPNTSYIIGGIVDKNRYKGLCYKRACERGIATAKLPIGEYMTMQSRTVLTVNHVVEIMLKWLETGDWAEAFLSVIPKRKEAKVRTKKQANEEEDGAETAGSEEDVEARGDVVVDKDAE